jgi:hypothetical protein
MSKKRKMVIRILAIVLAFLLILGVIASVSSLFGFAEPLPHSAYELDIYIHEENRAAEISQAVTYVNRTGKNLSYVMFNVYANAYRRMMTLPFEDDKLNRAFPAGYAPGGADFMNVSINGEPADWGMSGTGEQFMRVSCDIAPGESAEFGFDFFYCCPKPRAVWGRAA